KTGHPCPVANSSTTTEQLLAETLLAARLAEILEELTIRPQHQHVPLGIEAVAIGFKAAPETVELRILAIGFGIDITRLGIPLGANRLGLAVGIRQQGGGLGVGVRLQLRRLLAAGGQLPV